MKTKIMIGLLSIALFSVFASTSFAQPWQGWRGSGGWGMGSQYQRMYNPATVETLAGEIVSVDKAIPFSGMSYGVHLQVKTEKESIAVHLGPEWFVERLDTQLSTGDAIEVKGSRVIISGQPAFIAAEIKTGNSVLQLRNDAGGPVWSGEGMGSRRR